MKMGNYLENILTIICRLPNIFEEILFSDGHRSDSQTFKHYGKLFTIKIFQHANDIKSFNTFYKMVFDNYFQYTIK